MMLTPWLAVLLTGVSALVAAVLATWTPRDPHVRPVDRSELAPAPKHRRRVLVVVAAVGVVAAATIGAEPGETRIEFVPFSEPLFEDDVE